MEGVGDTYWACKQLCTICPICNATMQMHSIKKHYQFQHLWICIPTPVNPFLLQNPDYGKYTITAYDKQALIQCPVLSCGVTVKGGWYAICCHFLFCHHDIKIMVAEEGRLPWCHECGFHCALPHTTHQRSRLCSSSRAHNLRCSLTQLIIITCTAAPVLMARTTNLVQVTSFKYLGHWMLLDDSDTMAITQNIAKA